MAATTRDLEARIADLEARMEDRIRSGHVALAQYIVACWRAAGVNVPAVPDAFATSDESATAQVIQLFGGVGTGRAS